MGDTVVLNPDDVRISNNIRVKGDVVHIYEPDRRQIVLHLFQEGRMDPENHHPFCGLIRQARRHLTGRTRAMPPVQAAEHHLSEVNQFPMFQPCFSQFLIFL